MPVFSSARFDDWRAAIRRCRQTYIDRLGWTPDLWRPQRYTEKIQWRKLFDLNPVYATFCDKLAVRGYIAERLGEEVLVPLLWSGEDPAAIPFDTLTPPYVIKSTHASGDVIMVNTAEQARADDIGTTARPWLAKCYADTADEPGYGPVPPRIAVERRIFAADGSTPVERRMFAFDGRVRIINTVLATERGVRNGAFHTADWQRLNWTMTSPLRTEEFPCPKCFDQMIAAAEALAAGLDHVRVDIFDCQDRIYVGEITVYPWSGLSPFSTPGADEELGSYWKLKWPVSRALMTVLWRERRIPPRKPAQGGRGHS